MSVRLTFLEALWIILFLGGGFVALAADWLGAEGAQESGLIVMVASVVFFGLDMIVRRKAEIATRGSDDLHPSFNVFRGVGAIAWGVAFVVGALLFAGYAYISATNWIAAQNFFHDYPGVVVSLVGIMITAWGVGSATRASYRRGESEQPDRRLTDRLAAVAVIIPSGILLVSWGLLSTFAPAAATEIRSILKSAAVRGLKAIADRIGN